MVRNLFFIGILAVLGACSGMPEVEPTPPMPENEYLVVLKPNLGQGSMDMIRVPKGDVVTLPDNEFVRDGYDFVSWNTQVDGSGDGYFPGDEVTPQNHLILYAQWVLSPATSMHEGYYYVNLGLPSGTLWATHNVGAVQSEEAGTLYAWDAQIASIQWGGKWRMPSQEEVDELLDAELCEWTLTTQNGVKGYIVTSKQNGNALFLPHTGYLQNSQVINTDFCGLYWTQTSYVSDTSRAFCLRFNDDVKETYLNYVTYGFAVRPVWKTAE